MLFLHVCLSRPRPCHALCPLWVCACRSLEPLAYVVASTLLWFVGCGHSWDTPPWCWCAWCIPFLCFMRCCYACLACFVSPVWLSLLRCIFAYLPICSCMSLCVIHAPISWDYRHPIQTYICPPRTPSLFDNMLICPRLASFSSLSFSMLSFYLFLCLSANLFLLSLHVHAWSTDTWSKGATS